MRGVVDEVIVPGMRNRNRDHSAVPTDPIHFFDDVQEDTGRGSEVLHHVAHPDFADAAIRPRPWRHFQVQNKFRRRELVHVQVPGDRMRARAEVEL